MILDVDVCQFQIRLGVSLEQVISESKLNSKGIQDLIQSSEGKSFIIIPNIDKKLVHVLLSENINPSEMIEAYVRTVLTSYSVSNQNQVRIFFFSII